ncbi:MAG TPA: tetratricopeptide repeat protein [Polyangiaceae bacterium]|nr:tetratricopeptide repeat protein [Polyangiaceae bacterium]
MKARVAWAALLALLPLVTSFDVVAAPDAPAKEPTAVDEARLRFQKGVQLFHEWSFEAALAEFRKAYQLAPSYRVLYNIAQVHYELHNYVDALKAFRQYLNEGAADLPTDRRTQVEAEIRKLEGRVGYLEVVANVDSGQVAVDDVPVGMVPMKAPILVNPGVRRVSVTKPGFGTTARNVTIAGGDHAQVQVELNEAVASRMPRDEAARKSGRGEARADRPRTAMWITLAATGALGVGTGVFALLAQDAKRDFDHQLGVFPSSKADIDNARSTLVRKAAITDGLMAATAVAGGLTVFFALSGGAAKDPAAASTGTPQPPAPRVGIAPTLGGIVAVGSF